MRAMDVMTSEVITVEQNASVQAVAKLLAERASVRSRSSTGRTG